MAGVEDLSYLINLGRADPARLGQALVDFGAALARHPLHLARASADLGLTQTTVALNTLRRYLDVDPQADAAPHSTDRRFADRAWRDNPLLRGTLDAYQAYAQWSRRLLETANLPEATRRKARFALNALLDACAPSNIPWLNPAVVKEAIDTGGLSVARGMAQMLDDCVRRGGRPRQVDTSAFELGRNLAATPGRVVLRNDLMELLAYEPQTAQVYQEPIVCSPPWINKYYIMDLAPGRSFIEYAVKHGFTVFAISYRNPDASMARVGMDQYLLDGLLRALERAADVTGAPRVNVVALCLGGTLTAIALAYLAAKGQGERVGWATLTNTLVDFSEPGDLGIFTDEASIRDLEERMARQGYLEAASMAGTFNWLRANDLVWSYVVSNWYMGKPPPAFDILAWNADSTNLPAAMHSQYLRACYLENRLVRPGAFTIAGTPIDLSRVEAPIYVLGAEADHIAPWHSAYRTTQLVSGEARFTLTSSGHVAGIVNPTDNPRSAHWVLPDCPPHPEAWRARAERRQGSWWEDWRAWAAARSGPLTGPPHLPTGDPAPGRYVRG